MGYADGCYGPMGDQRNDRLRVVGKGEEHTMGGEVQVLKGRGCEVMMRRLLVGWFVRENWVCVVDDEAEAKFFQCSSPRRGDSHPSQILHDQMQR